MARRKRLDEPGAWHHVMNRGIAKRMLFETKHNMQSFGSLLGEAVERGEIEVHAFCLMGTHYHLLVRSLLGELGETFHRLQTGYSRGFNREQHRDGPLARGRFCNRRIFSHTYRRAVVSYIDRNPVSAGLVSRPDEYPYGSARAYMHPHTHPVAWLERSWVEETAQQIAEEEQYSPAAYNRAFIRSPQALDRVVEARWSRGHREANFDNLVQASPQRVQRWMRFKAQLADGTSVGAVIVDFETLQLAVMATRAPKQEPWRVGRRDAWCLVQAGLERDLCGATLEDIGMQAGISRTAAQRRVRDHQRLLREDGEYLARSAEVAHRALAIWR